MSELRGVITALITTFHASGAVDLQTLRSMVEFQIERGIHGFFPLGTMGMGPALTADQRKRMAEAIPNLVGVKAAFDSLKQHLGYLQVLPKGFVVLAGFHEYLLPTVPL